MVNTKPEILEKFKNIDSLEVLITPNDLKRHSKDFYSSKNQIRFLNSIFTTKINNKKNNNIYELISKESKINQTDFNYSGTVNVKPFYFNLNFIISNLNFQNIIFFNKIFEDILINFF